LAWQKVMQSAVLESPLNSDTHTPPIGSPAGTGVPPFAAEVAPPPVAPIPEGVLPTAPPIDARDDVVAPLTAAAGKAGTMPAAELLVPTAWDDPGGCTIGGLAALGAVAMEPLLALGLATVALPLVGVVVEQPEHTVNSVGTEAVAVCGSTNISRVSKLSLKAFDLIGELGSLSQAQLMVEIRNCRQRFQTTRPLQQKIGR
jgi:hypothetical protein